MPFEYFLMKYFFSLFFLCVLSFSIVQAHPMPNTDIAIRLDESFVTLEIRIPVPELVLALPESVRMRPGTILSDSRGIVEAYFKNHINVLSKSGAAQSINITSLSVSNSTDEFVGDYQELLLTAEVPVRDGFNPRDFLLDYDAVIHQVPNHFALVKITQDFNAGVFTGDKAVSVGAIRYDFSSELVPPLVVTVTDGGIFQGFYSMVTLGMNHILAGLDHILFLLTLLIVAPLAVKDGAWTLFCGFRYTVRRFLAISLAFTIGHSAALIFGAYDLLPVNRKIIEAAIAASILLTALHAIRPLFSRRETLVALSFGIIHGIAFSEVLISLRLTPLQKAISIFGFNLGIEFMQVIIMAIAFPVLLISRHKIYHSLRVVFASVTVIIACFWLIERVTGSTLLNILKN
ncbi:MAG TPA: HupE/UreJ family protein [Pyrinomonadaceae bacterium]|jgi:hypothetical protein